MNCGYFTPNRYSHECPRMIYLQTMSVHAYLILSEQFILLCSCVMFKHFIRLMLRHLTFSLLLGRQTKTPPIWLLAALPIRHQTRRLRVGIVGHSVSRVRGQGLRVYEVRQVSCRPETKTGAMAGCDSTFTELSWLAVILHSLSYHGCRRCSG